MVEEQVTQNPIEEGAIQTRRKRSAKQLSGVQIMFAAIVAIGMILAINFSTRLADSRPLNEYYENVQAEIARLRVEQATLIAEHDYSQSDAYVEQWAHADGKMVRPGEVLVIPLPANPDQAVTPIPLVFAEVETTLPKPDNWTLWWSLFFDSLPPKF